MDKTQALYSFWSGFDWPAIDEQSSYDEGTLEDLNIDFPYITFEVLTSDFGSEVSMTASLYDESTSWERITAKADEISAAIGRGGKILRISNGAVWIKRGSSFAQRMADDTKDNIRRIILTITAEFLTAE